jgi:ribosomal protein S18 acetylase RimI-like enzyme
VIPGAKTRVTAGPPAWLAVPVLELSCGLPASALDAIAELERATLAVDGGRLKLEWGVLRGRGNDQVEDLLWWEDGQLLGFLGLYSFGPHVELTGMVHPRARRRGIATALLDAALPLVKERGYAQALLVTPRTPTAGHDLALSRGATPDHSEYALQLTSEPADGPSNPSITVRPMTEEDLEAVKELLVAAFPWYQPDPIDPAAAERRRRDRAETMVIELDGVTVGSLRVSWEDDTAGVFGFAVRPDHQGQGIGRDVLRRICRQARADGAARVHLEVAVDNDRALGLYTSLGFAPIATEDYYSLPI